jgi:peptidoglycan hydrolase-like protein with peptidoglycan-binding domain
VSAEWEDFQRYRDSAIAVAGLDAAESNLFGALGLGLAQATHPRGSYEYQVRAGELMSNVGKVLLGGMRMGAHKAAVKDRVLRDKSPSRRVYGKRVDGEWKPGQPLPFPKDPGYLLPIFPLITPTPQPDVTRAPTPALGRKSETAIDVQPWYGRAFRNQRETTKLIKRLNSLAAQPSQGPAVWHAAASATCEGLARSGKVLSLGSRGEDVKAVQRLLGMSRADQDAKWGPRTERRYQDRLRSYGLSGPQASPELFRRLAADAERLRTLAESGTLLRQGTSGDDVRLLQRALGMPTYLQDGKYGPQTARWVRRKQTEFGITRDSVAGPQTLTHLLRASAIGR